MLSKPGPGLLPRDQVGRCSAFCPTGNRHEDGVTLMQALVRNVGTCHCDVKGEIQVTDPHKDERTEAQYRGGDIRTRNEGSVMGLDRRDVVIQFWYVNNPQGKD